MPEWTAKGAMRREQVRVAASRVLLAEGFRALTHRRVADAAGVPLGTTTYYFSDRADLMRAAAAHLLEREQSRRREVRVSSTSVTAVARALVELLLPPGAVTSREMAAVIYERLGEALRDSALRPVVCRDYEDLEAHAARILYAMPGAPNPARVLALVEGRLLQWLASERGPNALVAVVTADLKTLTAAHDGTPGSS